MNTNHDEWLNAIALLIYAQSEMRDIIFKISCLSLFWVNNNKDVRQTVVKYLLDVHYVILWQI